MIVNSSLWFVFSPFIERRIGGFIGPFSFNLQPAYPAERPTSAAFVELSASESEGLVDYDELEAVLGGEADFSIL